MTTYTAYIRSGVSVVLSGFFYVLGSIMVVGSLMDYYPDYEDILIASWLFIVLPLCNFITMLTSKSKVQVVINDHKIVLNVVRRSTASLPVHTILLPQIKSIQMKNGMMAGSYILLELEYGLRVKLHGKQFFFTSNNSFYEMFLELKKAYENNIIIAAANNNAIKEANTIFEDVVHAMEIEQQIAAREVDETLPPVDMPKQAIPGVQPIQAIAHVASAARNATLATDTPKQYMADEKQIYGVVYFKGSQFQSPIAIIMWLVFLFGSVIALIMGIVFMMALWVPVILLIAWLLPMSLLLNYIGVSQTSIEVKKHNVPGFKKVFNLNDIREVVFSSVEKNAATIAIVMKDFRYESYRCHTLGIEECIAIKNCLEQLNVKVKDEKKR